MAPLKFYADLKSQPCRAVYILMKANNIPFEFVKVDLFVGEQLQEDFTKINPIQRVPAIDDNGFTLGESGAIFRYLAGKFNVPDHWYPAQDLQKQARVDEYLNWHHTNTRMSTMMTFRHQFINTVRRKPLKQDEIAKFKSDLAKTVNHIGSYFLKDRRFIGGDDISVADLQAFCELMQLDVIGQQDLYLSNENVKKWAERVKAKVGSFLEECYEEGVGSMRNVWVAVTESKL
ncbi:glutathione S-transferase theta-1-like [Mya arenaria]|uniref:glutathione S-transferase theta-1-like n=1 Tax=Mya arenaria TaxID=6604 RepID=UPI0022E8382C|nr:glutathione S-transferase theta-1-like [Mya arenaria]